jgi:hypothetical protein
LHIRNPNATVELQSVRCLLVPLVVVLLVSEVVLASRRQR